MGRDETVLAIEVGATRLTAAVVGRDGGVRHSRHRRTPDGTEAAVEAVVSLAATVAGQATDPVLAVGVAVPAAVDVDQGIVRHSGELGWHNVYLAGAIRAELDVEVFIDHEVRAGALAEGHSGAGRGVADWLYLRIDDEIHAAAIVNGRLQRGATSAAGEVGHLPIYPFGLVCRCGQRGCVEQYASVDAVRRRQAKLSGSDLTVTEIAERFGRDPLVDEVWGQACAALGVALAMYTLVQDPQLVVLAGELTQAGGVLLSSVGAELRTRLAWREPPRLVIATARTPGLHGAAILAWNALAPS
jgi:glucokinase